MFYYPHHALRSLQATKTRKDFQYNFIPKCYFGAVAGNSNQAEKEYTQMPYTGTRIATCRTLLPTLSSVSHGIV